AAKHGVNGLTKVAALENGALNIRVNAVAPGAIDTPMLRGALEQFSLTEEDYAPQLSLLNRFGQPREVAEASLWLASDQSSYVTGTVIHVDAGYTSR
ncbi:MAG: SDR family oxidoreductase, partial [Acidimicrobiales bacterium]|nr:SDR family oxidoreductase [Acidimicrobiales bacterium]